MIKVIIVDDSAVVLPRAGATPGHLQARGHWIAGEYFRLPEVDLITADGPRNETLSITSG